MSLTIENLRKKVRSLESVLEKTPHSDDHSKVRPSATDIRIIKRDVLVLSIVLPRLQAKDELVRWEESKKWQAKMEKIKNLLKERERENETVSKQLRTLRDLYGR